MRKITILLADSFAIECDAFCKIIEVEPDLAVVGTAQNGREAVQLAAQLRPEVVMMDVAMPLLNGLEAARQIHKACPEIKLILMAAHSDESLLQNAMACGAAGFLLKQTSAEDVCRAVREVHRGITFFSPVLFQALEHLNLPSYCPEGAPKTEIGKLSSREMEVLQMIAEGNANKQIAAELGISLKTVEKHREHLMVSLGIHTTAGLTRYAVSTGIVECTLPSPQAPGQGSVEPQSRQ